LLGGVPFRDRGGPPRSFTGVISPTKVFPSLRKGLFARRSNAFEERLVSVLSTHFDGAWLFARRLGVHEADLDDVMQEVGAIVAARLGSIAPGSERSFVFSTVFRVAHETRRRRARRREVDEQLAADAVDQAERPDEVCQRQSERALLDRLLETMPLELRAVFVLFEIDERSQSEIAELLDLPVGTVASRLRRARQDFDARVARWQAQNKVIR